MNNKFSQNLKKIRKENNLSQESLADELGVSRQAISKWESSIAYPEMDKIIMLCQKFNLNIDDLLQKDIMEVKGEEESKKNINKYFDSFLNFITNSIDMFTCLKFKNKVICIFEQVLIISILCIIIVLIGLLGEELLSGIIGIFPDTIGYFLESIVRLIYIVFVITGSIVIMVHIFKTRYLDYYEREKQVLDKENKQEVNNNANDKHISLKNKEERIVIRDPKHSEYKFINGLTKGVIGFIKFFTMCFLVILCILLISLFCLFVVSFLIVKTGIMFIGLALSIVSTAIINIVILLLLLNFVFNKKNNKKVMIWSFLSSLIILGVGIGLFIVGTLNIEYIENDKGVLRTEYIEIKMRDDLLFGNHYPDIEYIESNNDNIKIEYTLNNYCKLNDLDLSNSVIHMWADCENPIELVKQTIKNLNNKKIVLINIHLQDIKIYTSKENIEKLKSNYEKYTNNEVQIQNMINSYEKQIYELNNKLDELIDKEIDYQNEIDSLKSELYFYQNNE